MCTSICIVKVSLYVHVEIIRSGFQGFDTIRIGVVELYMTFYDIENAMKVFDEMYRRDVIVWNFLIRGFYEKDDILIWANKGEKCCFLELDDSLLYVDQEA